MEEEGHLIKLSAFTSDGVECELKFRVRKGLPLEKYNELEKACRNKIQEIQGKTYDELRKLWGIP